VATEIQRQRERRGTHYEALDRDIVTAVRIADHPLQGALLTARLTLIAEGQRASWREMAQRAGWVYNGANPVAKMKILASARTRCAGAPFAFRVGRRVLVCITG